MIFNPNGDAVSNATLRVPLYYSGIGDVCMFVHDVCVLFDDVRLSATPPSPHPDTSCTVLHELHASKLWFPRKVATQARLRWPGTGAFPSL